MTYSLAQGDLIGSLRMEVIGGSYMAYRGY